MQARLIETTYRVDTDSVQSSDGTVYQIGDITLSCNDQLSLILDANSIRDRVAVYQHYGNWMCMTDDGSVIPVADESILEFLRELDRTIPPSQRL